MMYTNIVLVPTHFRSLTELSYEPTTNHKREINVLKQYGNVNEAKYQKNNYPNDDAKTKQIISEVTEKENILITNSKKNINETDDKKNKAKSNVSHRSLKYLEMQRKLYNNFYVKKEIDFQNPSDKSNDKYCECLNKEKSYDKLSPSNKVHDSYFDDLKKNCVGGAVVCSLSCTTTLASGVKTANTVSGFAWSTFSPYGIAIYVIVVVTIILIHFYVSLHERRKNTWKHEYKKHLYT